MYTKVHRNIACSIDNPAYYQHTVCALSTPSSCTMSHVGNCNIESAYIAHTPTDSCQKPYAMGELTRLHKQAPACIMYKWVPESSCKITEDATKAVVYLLHCKTRQNFYTEIVCLAKTGLLSFNLDQNMVWSAKVIRRYRLPQQPTVDVYNDRRYLLTHKRHSLHTGALEGGIDHKQEMMGGKPICYNWKGE